MRALGKLLTYSFLIAVGCTMLMPFLWMCSSALKPDDQIFRDNWIPTKEYVTVDGVEYVVERKQLAMPAGSYKVRILEGAESGSDRVVSTNDLAQGRGGPQEFIYKSAQATTPLRVQLVEKIQPAHYEVSGYSRHGEDRLKAHLVSEFGISSRPALQWSNFYRAVRVSGVFGRAYVNTLIVAILITVGQVFTSSLAAYAFARLKFPFRNSLFIGYLATMMIPGAVTMIPLFVVLKVMPNLLNALCDTHWWSTSLFFVFRAFNYETYLGKPIGLDSYFALIVPGLFTAYGTFMLRQFFMSLPRDLEDAAKIDGCGFWGIYCNVILPLSKPALATLTIFTFMGAWRSFMWPLVVASSPEMQVLPVMLQAFVGVSGTQWNLLMAGSLLVLAPMIIVFVFGQRFFVEGIQLGAVKG